MTIRHRSPQECVHWGPGWGEKPMWHHLYPATQQKRQQTVTVHYMWGKRSVHWGFGLDFLQTGQWNLGNNNASYLPFIEKLTAPLSRPSTSIYSGSCLLGAELPFQCQFVCTTSSSFTFFAFLPFKIPISFFLAGLQIAVKSGWKDEHQTSIQHFVFIYLSMVTC